MSVNYESALIYGCNCSSIQDEWPSEARDKMEELGYDVIYDGYNGEFLYIGKIISHTDCYEPARVDCLAEMEQAIIDLGNIMKDTPVELLNHLPLYKSIYHLCYAT